MGKARTTKASAPEDEDPAENAKNSQDDNGVLRSLESTLDPH